MPSIRPLPWALRVTWATLPFTVGPALASAVHGWSEPVRATASAGAWAAWAVALAATLVLHPISLTVVRLAAPGPIVVALAAAASDHASALAVSAGVVALALAFLPETGVAFVNGAAYPGERRFPLRAPGSLLLGPVQLAWALCVGPLTAGALLLAARRWVIGGALVALGAPVAVVAARSLHGLSRRWIVFVPAGVVLHDAQSLADPVLFERKVIESLRPAAADTDSLDLTQKSPGLALELILREKVPMVRVTPRNRMGEAGASARLLFTPTRPGAVLAEAAARKVPST